MTTSIEDYLSRVKSCDDNTTLQNELKVYDNWTVLLYGDDSYHKMVNLFAKSSGIINGSWKNHGEFKNGNELWFTNSQNSVYVQIANDRYHLYEEEEDRIKGNLHSMYLMLHPKLMGKQEDMKPAVVDLLEYLIKEGYQFRLPQPKLGISYDPEDDADN